MTSWPRHQPLRARQISITGWVLCRRAVIGPDKFEVHKHFIVFLSWFIFLVYWSNDFRWSGDTPANLSIYQRKYKGNIHCISARLCRVYMYHYIIIDHIFILPKTYDFKHFINFCLCLYFMCLSLRNSSKTYRTHRQSDQLNQIKAKCDVNRRSLNVETKR